MKTRRTLAGGVLATLAFITGCPDKGSGVDTDAGGVDVRPTDSGADAPGRTDTPVGADAPSLDVRTADVQLTDDAPADAGPPPAACEAAAVVDLNARGSADGGVLRYVGSSSSAARAASLRATCVGADGMGEALYQVVHRYVPRVTSRLRVSLDDMGTDASFDTVLFAQDACRVLLSEERPLGCNDDVRVSAASRPYASAVLTTRVVAGSPAFIVVGSGARGGTGSIVPYGAYALTVRELPEVALGAMCDLTETVNACAPSSTCLGADAASARCVMDGLEGTRCRTAGGTDCDAGLRCVDAFCRRALALGAPCGPDINAVCGEGASCQWVDGSNRCVTSGTRGADCRTMGAPCDMGLACVHTRSGDHCRPAVAAGAACDPWRFRDACPAATGCAFAGTAPGSCVAPGSVAGAPCSDAAMRCAAGLECRPAPDGENEVCVRSVAPAGACDPLGATTLCSMDTDCAVDAALTGGTCSAPGTPGAPCRAVAPRCDTGAECSTATTGGRCQRVLAAGAPCDLRNNSTRCTGGACVADGATGATCRASTAETEPNDAPAMGTAVTGAYAVMSGALSGTDLGDCLRVTVTEGSSLVAETHTGDDRECVAAGGDPTLSIYGPSGALILREDDSPRRGLCATVAPWTHPQASGLAAGSYAVCVGRGEAAVAAYRLTVSVFR